MKIQLKEVGYGGIQVRAEEKNAVIGTVTINDYKLWSLFVEEEHREKGLASTLLIMAESVIRSEGYSFAWLYCYEDKLEFYQKRGWQVVQQCTYWSDDKSKYNMIKNLWEKQ